jgi:hypothetical protein
VGIDTSGYYFDPGIASLGAHWVLYEYVSDNQCSVRDSMQLTVNFAPTAAFNLAERCVPVDGGEVHFENTSDIGTSQSVSWLWNFEDPPILPEDRSDSKNPIHDYDTGSYTVSLNVIVGNCTDIAVKTIDIHANPEVEFTLSSICQSDDPIIMTGQEVVYYPDSVIFWAWKIDSAETEIFRSDTSDNILSYIFPSDTTYTITYSVTSNVGCTNLIEKESSLSKTHFLSEDSPYLEDFEFEDHGWTAVNIPQNSWTYGEVNPEEFPINAASGIRAWYTDRPDEATSENSWVLSPCYNFSEYHRPMVSLDIKRSLHRDRDAAALQYTIDNGNTWHNVGDVDDGGLHWYNIQNTIPNVGGKKTGWTGDSISPKEDDQWFEAAHGLDELVGQAEVRFRVAFGSLDDARTETNDGFAFDNFSISQRTKLSVLEYFTNANNSECANADTVIMEIMNKVPADVIDIQYHVAGNLADKFYIDNGALANNRGTIYGVTGIPYAILDGNFMTYDFTSNKETPNVEEIRQRSLMDPDFQLTITVTHYTPTLEFSIEMKALRDLDRKERTLYAIVLERRVDDSAYVGTNGITVFRHVARKMLPGIEGTYLGSKEWNKDETEYANLTYEPSFFSTDTNIITIAVFMQDDETGEILQAATNPQYTVSIFDGLEPPSRVLIYPNPARELVNVYFEESPREEMRFTLYDLSGKMVITDVIEPWEQLFTRTLSDLEQGLYIVEIRSKDRRRVLYRDKLLHY